MAPGTPTQTHTRPKVATHVFLDGVGVLNAHHPLTHQHCLLLVAECLERGQQFQVSTAPYSTVYPTTVCTQAAGPTSCSDCGGLQSLEPFQILFFCVFFSNKIYANTDTNCTEILLNFLGQPLNGGLVYTDPQHRLSKPRGQ